MSRALVLGGGGVAGIAWETGLLFGLAEHRVDVTTADLVIGTSAGSTMGAQLLSGTPLAELYDRHVFPKGQSTEIAAKLDPDKLAREWMGMLANHDAGQDLRAAIGRFALASATPPERARRAVIEARLPVHEWPQTPLQIVAVDASTGAERIFTRDDGVSIVDAVAASCAVPGIWPPVTIGDRRYFDGGVRTSANIDLAEGHDVVLVLAPVGDLIAPEPQIDKRVRKLHKDAKVVTIEPDASSREAIGPNPLDPTVAKASAQAGRAQAASVAAEVLEVWA